MQITVTDKQLENAARAILACLAENNYSGRHSVYSFEDIKEEMLTIARAAINGLNGMYHDGEAIDEDEAS